MIELAQFAHVPHELEHTGLVFVGDERPARACVCVCVCARARVCVREAPAAGDERNSGTYHGDAMLDML